MTLIRLGLFCFIESLLFAISSQELSAPQAVVRSGCLLLQLTPPARRKPSRHTTILGQFFSRANSWDAGVVALALLILRLEPIFHRCREEEVNCKQYIPLELLSSLSPDALFWRSILATSSLLSLNVVIGRALPQAVPSSLRIARALSWPAHASITFYHMVKLVPQSEEMQPRLQTMGIVLAQMVYGCSMLAIFICVSFNS
ncbi:unnamed protein product [Nippostrongylus brasiliensis]|uniref:Membrane-associated protein n=1 Tax=Nippostrongylus brasiliensis TaxID=27835 RepID=A0A0N4YTI0_NIPBR|nr:unnamed protein product [Nippostrongylus brasiliensis]